MLEVGLLVSARLVVVKSGGVRNWTGIFMGGGRARTSSLCSRVSGGGGCVQGRYLVWMRVHLGLLTHACSYTYPDVCSCFNLTPLITRYAHV